MAARNLRIPVCPDPFNPEKYKLIMKPCPHWRRKRGTVIPVKLNKAFAENARLLKICSPAAKRIKAALLPYLERMDTGRLIATISSQLRKGYKQEGNLQLSWLQGLEINYQPLHKIFPSQYSLERKNGIIRLHLPVHKHAIIHINKSVIGFKAELIMLLGKPGLKDLRIESTELAPFIFEEQQDSPTGRMETLELIEPPAGTSWMILLKVEAILCKAMTTARGIGMKVIGGD